MPRLNGVVALLTDFGLKDHYAGVMKGAILTVCPDARIVDLGHEVDSQDVAAGYFLLRNSYRYFPKGTLFVCVIDPGVGTERSVIGVETGTHTFLAPDNGLLGFLERDEEVRRAVRITNDRYFLKPVSSTFHGRDIFAPVAGHLLAGVDLGKMGKPAGPIRRLETPSPREEAGTVLGEIVRIDRFGNLVTNIPGAGVPKDARIRLGRAVIQGVSTSYGSRKKNELLAYVGSGGCVEIAVNQGSAARRLRARIGQVVRAESP